MSSLPTPLIRKTLSVLPLSKNRQAPCVKHEWAQPCPHAKAIKIGLAAGIVVVVALYAIMHIGAI